MDPLLDARLSAIEAKLEANTKILACLNKAQRIATYTRYAYWLVLIVVGIASLYFIEPYLTQLSSAYGLIGGSSSTEDGGSTSAQDLLEQLRQYQQNQGE